MAIKLNSMTEREIESIASGLSESPWLKGGAGIDEGSVLF